MLGLSCSHMFMIKKRLADAIGILVMPEESRPRSFRLFSLSIINSFWPIRAVGRRV